MTQEEKQHLLKIDICGRLPYGLYFVDKVYKKTFTLLSINKSGYEMELFLHEDHNVLISEGNSLYEDAYTPILRPIEDLCREITHKGVTFVPIVEWAKFGLEFPNQEFIPNEGSFESNGEIEYHTYGCENDRYQFAYHTGMKSFIALDKSRTPEFNHVNNQALLFDLMNRLMIDYRGLIPAGLAKSVHDLDKNPYE